MRRGPTPVIHGAVYAARGLACKVVRISSRIRELDLGKVEERSHAPSHEHASLFLISVFTSGAIVRANDSLQGDSKPPDVGTNPIRGEEHCGIRDGLRIYLWEKHQAGLEGSFAASGRVSLLVHGGTWSGRPDFDIQIRDYSLMDFLAQHDYDVWAIDIHGYGHSDKTDKDWSGVRSAAADIAAAIEYITKLRGESKVDLLGWSAATQRAGLYAMQHPDRAAKLILYAPHWRGDAEYACECRSESRMEANR